MSFEKLSIFIDGALGLLGAEVARLGVAAAQHVHGLSEAHDLSTSNAAIYSGEPWVQGVTWVHTPDGTREPGSLLEPVSSLLPDAHALVLADVERDVSSWRARHALVLEALPPLLEARDPSLGPLALVIVCDPSQGVYGRELFEALSRPGASPGPLRLVVACVPFALYSPGYREEHEALSLVPEGISSCDPAAGSMRVELAAMAILRLAMEDDREGVFDIAQIAHIGDAMMLQ